MPDALEDNPYEYEADFPIILLVLSDSESSEDEVYLDDEV
jgi:hypothetical protein